MRSINKRDLIKHQLISFGLSSIVTVSDWVAKYPFFLWRAEYLIKMFCSFNLLSSIEIPWSQPSFSLCNNQKQSWGMWEYSVSWLRHSSRDILDSVHLHPGSRDQLDVANYHEEARTVTVTLHCSIVPFIICDETFSPSTSQTGPVGQPVRL